MEKLLFSLTLILGGLLTGYGIRSLSLNGLIRLPVSLEQLRKLLQNIGMFFLMPVSFMAAVWVVQFSDTKILLLPMLGVIALLTGGVLGLGLAKLINSPPTQKGALFCCCSFTNIGAIGALICYVFLGEAGFALVALYKMFEEIYYYTVGFPLARFFSGFSGSSKNSAKSVIRVICSVLADPYVAVILVAFITGLVLNLGGIERPPVFETVNSFFIPIGILTLIVSIGLGLRISKIRGHLFHGMCVTVIKSIIVPVIVIAISWQFGVGTIDNGLSLMVILILSSMPVAFNAIIAVSIYDLDLDLANSCWLISTLSLCVVVPWLYWLQQII